jgi:hypothetical protein
VPYVWLQSVNWDIEKKNRKHYCLSSSPLPSLLLPCRRLAFPFLLEANSGIKDHRSSDLDSIHYTRRAKTLGAMDPQLKLALEAQTRSFISELDKKFADHDAKWESRVGELEKAAVSAADQFYDLEADIHTDVTAQLEFFVSSATEQANRVAAATMLRVLALESTTAAFEAWRPAMESSIAEVKRGVAAVQAAVANIPQLGERRPLEPPHLQPGILGEFGSGPARPSTGLRIDGPDGHCSDHHRREAGFGRVYASTHLPPNGMPPFNSPTFSHLLGSPHSHSGEPPSGVHAVLTVRSLTEGSVSSI